MLCPAADARDACAYHFQYAVWLHQFDERVKLTLVARHFNRNAALGNVNDFSPEDIGDAEYIRPRFGIRGYLYKTKLAENRCAGIKLNHIDYIYQLRHLALDLLNHPVVALHRDGYAGVIGILRGAAADAVYIVTPAAE